MEAREREGPQYRRPSIKRPWEDDTIQAGKDYGWRAGLPITQDGTSNESLISQNRKAGESTNTQVTPNDLSEGAAKRARYDRHPHDSLSQANLVLNENLTQAQNDLLASTPSPNPSIPKASAFPHGQPDQIWEERRVNSLNNDGLAIETHICQRCMRLITNEDEAAMVAVGGRETESELTAATEEAASTLSKLATVLRSRIPSVHIHTNSPIGKPDEAWDVCPPIAHAGPRQTFQWILDKIRLVNELADRVVQFVPIKVAYIPERSPAGDRILSQHDAAEDVKRRPDHSSDQVAQTRDHSAGTVSENSPHTRMRLSARLENGADHFSSLKASPRGLLPGADMDDTSLAVMNPPPAPPRRLPSPPGRSFPSPTSLSFPSPSIASHGSGPQPPPLNIHNSSLGTQLPPIMSPHSADALQVHSAALQHEVSVQKLALSSLQGEHDKLLAAFSRSQLRASALEKKHEVSDHEINMLSEEKLRLQSQVLELERDTEELMRSRDETRQAAVKDGAQYMEIVQKASRLEEMAAEERRRWNKVKMILEYRIESLQAGTWRGEDPLSATTMRAPLTTPQSIVEAAATQSAATRKNIDINSPGHGLSNVADPVEMDPDDNNRFKEEINRLRDRCVEVEHALHIVINENRTMGEMVDVMNSMRKNSLEEAITVLGEAGNHGREGHISVREWFRKHL